MRAGGGGAGGGRTNRETDEHNEDKFAFRNFANAPENELIHLQTCDFPPGKRKPGVDHVREMIRPENI